MNGLGEIKALNSPDPLEKMRVERDQARQAVRRLLPFAQEGRYAPQYILDSIQRLLLGRQS